MELVNISQLHSGNILAKAVKKDGFRTLLYEGTKLLDADIEMFKAEGIESVYIFSNDVKKIVDNEKKEILAKLKSDIKEKLEIIERRNLCINEEAGKQLTQSVDKIYDNIFKTNDPAITIYDLKEAGHFLYDHLITVSVLSVLTALKLSLSDEEICEIGVGALFHDMGLLYTTVDYEDKGYEDFSADELFEFKKHTLYGFSTYEDEKSMTSCAKRIMLQHHEHLDGTGYPFRQRLSFLPVKIVSLCDAYCDRICGIGCKRLTADEAIMDIEKYRDIYYDGRVIDIFESFVAMYPTGTIVGLSSGDEAEVVSQVEFFTDRPVIKLLKNSNGEIYDREKIINLSENNSVKIEKTIVKE